MISDSYYQSEGLFGLDFKLVSQSYDVYGLTRRDGAVKIDLNASPVFWFNLNSVDSFKFEREFFETTLDS